MILHFNSYLRDICIFRFLLYLCKANIMSFRHTPLSVEEYISCRTTNTIYRYRRHAGVIKLVPLVIYTVFSECNVMAEVHRPIMINHPYEVVN